MVELLNFRKPSHFVYPYFLFLIPSWIIFPNFILQEVINSNVRFVSWRLPWLSFFIMEPRFKHWRLFALLVDGSTNSVKVWMVECLLSSDSFSWIHSQHLSKQVQPDFIHFPIVAAFDGLYCIYLSKNEITSGNFIPTNLGFLRKYYLWLEIKGPKHFCIK